MPVVRVDPEPLFLRPELLTHSPIPPPLYNYNPRTVMGKVWWDTTRKKAYRENRNFCWACGASGMLHAHEAYSYDYDLLLARLDEVVALCEDCHRFVHLEMTHETWRYTRRKYVQGIIDHGLSVLGDLEPNWLAQSVIYLRSDENEGYSTMLKVAREVIGVESEFVSRWLRGDWALYFDDTLYGPNVTRRWARLLDEKTVRFNFEW